MPGLGVFAIEVNSCFFDLKMARIRSYHGVWRWGEISQSHPVFFHIILRFFTGKNES